MSLIVGKSALESLTIGMYSDHFTLYREYIQNSTDSIDNAVKENIIKKEQGTIEIKTDKKNRTIIIRDNGTGIAKEKAYKVLGDVGNSEKDYKESRGFRGIGRLGGLSYAEELIFTTKYKGENENTIIKWDCRKLKEFLQPGKYKHLDLLAVIENVTSTEHKIENIEEHYFEVKLINVLPQFEVLLDEKEVEYYISTVAPIPFDMKSFIYSAEIKEKIVHKNKPLEEYKIYINNSPKQVYKKYKTHFKTGHQTGNKKEDYITDIEIFEDFMPNGELMYIGWIGLHNFFGSVQDEFMKGIRIRKGNILIGNEKSFSQFFTSEKDVANGWFIGEVYIYDSNIIPNARRDDFEKNKDFDQLYKSLNKKADDFNKRLRREMSKYNSAIKKIEDSENRINEISQKVENGGVTSDVEREKLIEEKKNIEKVLENSHKELQRIIDKSDSQGEKTNKGISVIQKVEKLKAEINTVENKIINADYCTKNDLPTSFSKEQRKLYQKIIEVIFQNLDQDKAEELRQKIIQEIGGKKKC